MDDRKDRTDRVAALLGRIELLVAHLAGSALRRRIDAEDLVADVAVKLLESPRVAALTDDELWPYARSVTRSVVVDAARRARHGPRRMSSLAGGEESSSAPSGRGASLVGNGRGPASLAAGREGARTWLEAFQRLTPEHRRVLGLRRFEGLSAREAAERMGRSEAAVHSLFRRALEAWSVEAEGNRKSRGESDEAAR